MADPRYPIGKFKFEGSTTDSQRNQFIEDIEQTPAALRSAIKNLDAKQIETPYRDGGWTVRQVVHHVPESHMNAYIRFKLALTEEEPTVKPYMEDRWAVTGDVESTPLDVSLAMLDSLHDRWVRLLRYDEARGLEAYVSGIRRWDWFRWRETLRCMRGTGSITWRTLRSCENGWGGNYLLRRSTGSLTSVTRKYFASAGCFFATASYIA